MKRIFDFFLSIAGILILSPLLFVLAIMISFESKGGFLFSQIRIGQYGNPFKIFKFRTMYVNSEKNGLLTVGNKDKRITKLGFFLRKYKLDELPQLFNVFFGNMSFVGPRPEVPKYVNLYNEEQRKILLLKPGITDFASIYYKNENHILGLEAEPEKYYVENIMPHKIELNMMYSLKPNILMDLTIIIKTIKSII